MATHPLQIMNLMAQAAQKKQKALQPNDDMDAEGNIDTPKAAGNKKLSPQQVAAAKEKRGKQGSSAGQANNSGNSKVNKTKTPKVTDVEDL